MPVWTPGSYLVREYARHVEGLGPPATASPLTVRKIRKNAWRVEHDGATRIEIEYQLYANELTVRTNHVDANHAYWNGAATYLGLEEAPHAGARVSLDLPQDWDVATALARDESSPHRARLPRRALSTSCATHRSSAASSSSDPSRRSARRTALRRPTAPTRAASIGTSSRPTRKTIVETEARLIAGDRSPEDALPYDRYLFSWHVSTRGRGGLEHRDCTTLMAKPSSFQTRTGYLDVLSLIAHEYFHLWNVKRIRPAGLSPYRYEQESYTRLLWWFEGRHELLRLAHAASRQALHRRRVPEPPRRRNGAGSSTRPARSFTRSKKRRSMRGSRPTGPTRTRSTARSATT